MTEDQTEAQRAALKRLFSVCAETLRLCSGLKLDSLPQ